MKNSIIKSIARLLKELIFYFAVLIFISACATKPANRHDAQEIACEDKSEQEIASLRGISLSTLHLLRENRSLFKEDICNISEKKLARAVYRSNVPKPDRPGEAIGFRNMQQGDENGNVPMDGFAKARVHMRAMRADKILDPLADAGIERAGWRSIGPGNIGGRVRSIIFHPTNTDTMWIGSVTGGIWTTTNGGASWSPVDDFMSNLAVSTLAINPANPNILYAGTGEGFFKGRAIQGAGVFRSLDGGTTWNQLGSTTHSDWHYVNRLSISPASASTLLAATNSGIWRSQNDGDQWLKVSNESGVLDINFHPTDGTKAIASGRYGTYFSTDSGMTWQFATDIYNQNDKRSEVVYAPSNPNTVYASIEFNKGEIWKSADGGQSYTLINTGENYLGTQGWYDNIIWVDPTNENTIIVGGIDLWRSTNAGNTLSKISQWQYAPISAHADQHYILAHPNFNGTTNKTVYFANDGGIYRTSDVYSVSGTSGWQGLNNNLRITQFYGAAGNPITGKIIGGAQDNGTLVYNGDAEDWRGLNGGDGGFCAADPSDPSYFYGEFPNLQIHRSANGGASSTSIHTGIDDAGSNANFVAPFILDPNNPNTMLAGGERLWRSNNVKANTPSWSEIKPSIRECQYIFGFPFNCTPLSNISAIAVAKGNSNIVWVGHNNGHVYKTVNGTASTPTWSKTDDNDVGLPNRYVHRITVDPHNSNIVYVTFGGFSVDNIYRSVNGGSTWARRTGDGTSSLPDVPVRSLVVSPFSSDFIYAGTEVGIFASEDAGLTWGLPHDGPANVSVDELFWLDSTTLIAATHGRGLFKHEVNSNQNKPDLVVIDPAVSKTALTVNENFKLLATVKNQGSTSAVASTLRYFLSTDTTISPADIAYGADVVATLAANTSGAQDISFNAPTVAGTYWVGGCVDAVAGESSTTNNCSTGVQITVSNSVAPSSLTMGNNQWAQLSLSSDPGLTNSVADVFAGILNAADYNRTWVMYRYDAANNKYDRLATSSPLEMNQGYWIKQLTGSDVQFTYSGAATPVVSQTVNPNCPSIEGCYEISLTSPGGSAVGWNLIGHPFAFDVKWTDLRIEVDGAQVCTPAQARTATILVDAFWHWEGSSYEGKNSYVPPDGSAAFNTLKAYWIRLNAGAAGKTVKLLVPKGAVQDAPSCTVPTPAAFKDDMPRERLFGAQEVVIPWWLSWVSAAHADQQASESGQWWLRLQAQSGETSVMVDEHNYLGWYDDASDGKDARDVVELAPFAAPYLSIVFRHSNWGSDDGDYASDFRPTKNRVEGEQWAFLVKSDRPGRRVTLSWEADPKLEELRFMRLVDVESGQAVQAFESGQLQTYSFITGGTEHRFIWKYGHK